MSDGLYVSLIDMKYWKNLKFDFFAILDISMKPMLVDPVFIVFL